MGSEVEGKDKLILLLKKAQLFELNRFRTYSRNSAKVLNPEGKEVLLFLANSEKRHLELLKNEILKLKETDKIQLQEISKFKLKFVPGRKERKFNESIRSIMGDINILNLAVELEKQDTLFYENLLKQTSNKRCKKLFQFIKRQEAYHLEIIKTKLSDLKKISASLSAIADPRIMFFDTSQENNKK
ncbi:ferritin-like domain-containing protein [Candidatus Pacearchaeota archaeon]|nr:ferritin-like domain-containing protein [Candidatus Pacearchaeota archaeon]